MGEKQFKVTISGTDIYTDGDFIFDEKPQKKFFGKIIIKYADNQKYCINNCEFIGNWHKCIEFLQRSCHTLIKSIDGRYFDISDCLVSLGKIIEWCSKNGHISAEDEDNFKLRWIINFTGNASGSIVFAFEEMLNNDKLKEDTKNYIKSKGKDLRLSQLINVINFTDKVRIYSTDIEGPYCIGFLNNNYTMKNITKLFEGFAEDMIKINEKYKDYIVHQVTYDNEALEIYIYDIQNDQDEEFLEYLEKGGKPRESDFIPEK